ncbi:MULTISPECIES: hypothetical protein [unclassified Methylobacterium]|uniref:hypothetical protein n=1 Tax=unclassified Methylobacterium TaxID=2615210 RepID=UPI0011C1E296|nr:MULTISPECIES: hypothetical protein [unclassified Methylobacterium]QEE41328.1 hypothetical protein FVA80_22560 [Methylobacterium sp. WL1]TXN57758.1 hypothetical protein FV241_09875 [Methylobacterium sp. WL2]
MPETLPGWVLFAAMMASATGTLVAGTRLSLAELRQAKPDRQDMHSVRAFGTLLIVSTLLFLFVEGR